MSNQDNAAAEADDNEVWLIDESPAAHASLVHPGGPHQAGPASQGIALRPFRVLIVDDEPDVHSVTRLALRDIQFKGRALELISAYSGEEAFAVLRDNRDIALCLLDVVMESEDAGLLLVERVRNELGNSLLRIVLRTGQSGQAPEQRVIVDYDINDYKAKTDLTTQKLFTTVITSLRSYENLMAIESSRIGLTKILDSAGNLYQIQSLRAFASGALKQVSAILDVGAEGILCVLGPVNGSNRNKPSVVAATGSYASLAGGRSDTESGAQYDNEPGSQSGRQSLPGDHCLAQAVATAFSEKRSRYGHPVDVLFVQTEQGHEFAIAITPAQPLADVQHELLEIYCHRIGAAFDNLYLFGQLRKAQEASVVALADLAEFRDEDTGGHVRRVQLLTDMIAQRLLARQALVDELTPQLLDMVGMASILHDVGKVSTPDSILLKPGRHTPEERTLMERHASVGQQILQKAAKIVDGDSYLTFGAQIAGGHHEHFDGRGYPQGLKGKDIPLSARIVAVVDVFDALLHRRPYKEPWSMEATVFYLHQRRGTQFDSDVIDALFSLVDDGLPEWVMQDD
jgi:response regulator RpfG family c-di-GMP phosphodiesterase